MISLAVFALAVVPLTTGLCHSPLLRGMTPDVILTSVVSSSLHCPPPHVFDVTLCVCVDPRVARPNERRTRVQLSSNLLSSNVPDAKSAAPTRSSASLSSSLLPRGPIFRGLPDMHHVIDQSQPWNPVFQPYLGTAGGGSRGNRGIDGGTSDFGGGVGKVITPRGRLVVPALNPFGSSSNIPANSKMLAAFMSKSRRNRMRPASSLSNSPPLPLPTITSNIIGNVKRLEQVEKSQWQEKLRREAVGVEMAAAAEMAAVAAAAASVSAAAAVADAAGAAAVPGVLPGSSLASGNGEAGSGLDSFMRDTLQRILFAG